MNPLLNIDMFLCICDLFKMLDILKLQRISKFHLRLIRTNNWYKMVYTKNDIILEHILDKYNFKNLHISSGSYINYYIHKLKYCHTLNVSGTSITDESVCELINCKILDLHGTNVTYSVSKLINTEILDLRWTRITDDIVSKLVNCRILNLSYCTRITDAGIINLTNCKKMCLTGTSISFECIHKLVLNGCEIYKKN